MATSPATTPCAPNTWRCLSIRASSATSGAYARAGSAPGGGSNILHGWCCSTSRAASRHSSNRSEPDPGRLPYMARHRAILLAVLIMLGIPNVHAQTQDAAPEAQLKALLDEDLDATLRRNPIGATVRGVPGYNHL